jgi:hypothetical protein
LASGVFNTAQQVGNALALAALGTLAASHTAALIDRGLSQPQALTGGYQAGFPLPRSRSPVPAPRSAGGTGRASPTPTGHSRRRDAVS